MTIVSLGFPVATWRRVSSFQPPPPSACGGLPTFVDRCYRQTASSKFLGSNPNKRRRTTSQSLTRAFADRYGSTGRSGDPRSTTYERVLRYPEGVRVLRYPVPTFDGDDGSAIETGDHWETLNMWKMQSRRGASTGVHQRQQQQKQQKQNKPPQPATATSSPSTLPKNDTPPSTTERHPSEEVAEQNEEESIPSSPMQLLRMLTSPARREAQLQEWNDLLETFTVLRGCPWPNPRPLYVLATAQPGRETPFTYTLRTRLPRQDLENELTKVLGGRQRPDSNEALISCGEVLDGVVAFENEDAAVEYGKLMEKGGAISVSVARCDSHELFRGVQDVNAAVVLIKPDVKLPSPHQLRAALVRGRRPFDDETEL